MFTEKQKHAIRLVIETSLNAVFDAEAEQSTHGRPINHLDLNVDITLASTLTDNNGEEKRFLIRSNPQIDMTDESNWANAILYGHRYGPFQGGAVEVKSGK